MKKRRIFTAVILLLATFALAIPTQLFGAIMAASRYDNLISPTVEVKALPSSGILGETVFIPAPDNMEAGVTANDTDKTYDSIKYIYSLTVSRAKEGKINLQLTEQNGVKGWSFKANYTGVYTFFYTVKAKDGRTVETTSPSFTVKISGPDAIISLPENSKYTVPNILPVNAEVRFPVATIEKGTATGVRTAVLSRNGVTVKTFTDADIQTDSEGNQYYVAYKMENSGTYTLTYQYQIGLSEPFTLEPKTYVVKPNYDLDNIKLTLVIKNTPSTATLGVVESLPVPTVTDSNGNTITAYIEIEVYKLNGEKDSVLIGGRIDGFNFTPNEAGDYRIYYTAVANYGGKIIRSTRESFKLTGVKDNVAPTAKAVNEYKMDGTGLSVEGITAVRIDGTFRTIQEIFYTKTGINYTAETFKDLSDSYKKEVLREVLEDRSYDIPSAAVVGSKIYLPAIYATDNFSEFGSSTNGIEVIRQIKLEGSNTVQPLNVFSGDVAEYTFTVAGTHTIRYYAKDKNSNNNEEVELASYTIIVTETKPADSTPEIKGPKLPASVEKTDTITIEIPPSYITDVRDQRLDVRVYWSFINDFSNLKAGTVQELKKENSKYIIDLSLYEESEMGTDGAVYICVTATNDDGVTAKEIDSVQVKNVGANKDGNAPIIETVENDYQDALKTENGLTLGADLVFKQGSEIKLPSYTISDDKGASMNVMVTNEYGKIVRVKNASPRPESVSGKTNYTISNSYFVAASGGVHYITYYAVDGGNNITFKTFAIEISLDNATVDYIQTETLPNTLERGVYYELPKLVAMNGTEKVSTDTHDVKLTWTVNTPINMTYQYEGNVLVGFTPLEVTKDGEFIEFIASGTIDGVALTSKTYRQTVVKDSNAPILTPESYYKAPTEVEYVSGMEIYLPNYEAVDKDSDGNIIEVIDNILVTATKGSDEVKVVKVVEDVRAREGGSSGTSITRYKFTPTSKGEWVITYKATDESGLSSTKTLTIKVGDCDAPELTWTNKANDLITDAKVGSSYELKLNFFQIFDKDTEGFTEEEYLAYISDSEYVNIYLTDPDSKTVTNQLADATNKGYKWTFNKAGTYTLYFKLTDKSGNTSGTTYSYTIKVTKEDSGSQKDKQDVAGIVLISVSATVVAIIIGYFIYTGIKSSRNKGKSVFDKKDDDKIVK